VRSFNPLILLVKVPAAAPSTVIFSAIVGEVQVLQQTPRVRTVLVPSLLISPPPIAEFAVILIISEVVG
jgi:hypothetical protein